MKKAQFLVILVAAAVVVLAAISLCFDVVEVQALWPTVGGFARAVEADPLPSLSEPAPQKPQTPEGTMSDNTTAQAPSGGAIKASFTVVSHTVDDHGESGTSSEGCVARDPNSTSATAPIQVVSGVAVDDWPVQNDQLGTAVDPSPKSSGATVAWAFIFAVWVMGIAAVGVLAFRHGRARKPVLTPGESSDSP